MRDNTAIVVLCGMFLAFVAAIFIANAWCGGCMS
jgi:hypothetical protein